MSSASANTGRDLAPIGAVGAAVINAIRKRCIQLGEEVRPGDEQADVREAERERLLAADRARSQSIVYPHYADASIVGFTAQPGTSAGLAAAMSIVESGFCRSLGLYGPDPGVGKTYLAHAVLNAANDRGISGAIINAVDLIAAVNDAKRTWDVSENETIEAFARRRVLVIDDLGKELLGTESMVGRAIPVLYHIVNARANHGLPLVVTSNQSFVQLSMLYSRRRPNDVDELDATRFIMDRLRDIAQLPWVEMRGQSLRGQRS